MTELKQESDRVQSKPWQQDFWSVSVLSTFIRRGVLFQTAQCRCLPDNSKAELKGMRLLVVLTCLLACCLAEKPHPCKSPPLLSGAFTLSTQNEKLWYYSKYLYDLLGERVRLMEIGTYENKSFTYDALLLFREHAMYEINTVDRTCKKKPLNVDFHPIAVPKDASLLGQAVIGSSSGPGQGLLVNTWVGDVPDKSGKYMMTVTEFGCVPVSTTYHTSQFGWVVTSFFNNIIGISDPGELNPPDFCEDAEINPGEEPTDFFSLFMNKL